MTQKPYELRVKTIVVGNSSVDQTSIRLRFINQAYMLEVPFALAIDNLTKAVDIQTRKLEVQL
jgi:hypothetical protein